MKNGLRIFEKMEDIEVKGRIEQIPTYKYSLKIYKQSIFIV